VDEPAVAGEPAAKSEAESEKSATE
jgi:hypothetical protein